MSPTFEGRIGRDSNVVAGLHMEEFQKALAGEISTEDWDAPKLVDYHKFLKEESKTEEGRVAALREAKRVENERAEKAKKEADEAEEAAKKAKEGKLDPKPEGEDDAPPAPSPEMAQFRTEQVEKAKKKFLSTVNLSDEEKEAVEEKFSKLDSGKLDADLIYEDYVSAFAAANPSKFLELSSEKEERERKAQERLEEETRANGGKPPELEEKKYSDEALALARSAGISPEAATRQLSEGLSRTFGEE